MPDYASYVICTSPRSGSTLLCKLLASTGIAGKPGSHFHEPSLQSWLEYYELAADPNEAQRDTLVRVFDAAVAKGTDGTGMFGLRLQRHSFAFFVEQLAVLYPRQPSDLARFEAAFGPTLFIHLTRPDKVAQAVSCLKAEQSGLWHVAPDGSEIERTAPPKVPSYDGAALRSLYEEFTGFDEAWPLWFASQGIEPLRITYDELSADPQATLRQVLGALGLEPRAADGVAPGVAKLADGISAEWVSRFRSENGLA